MGANDPGTYGRRIKYEDREDPREERFLQTFNAEDRPSMSMKQPMLQVHH